MQAILHCDRKWGIGKHNDLMFRLPLDMAYFREKTTGKVVVMGSNTLLSFPGGKPLKNRTNIVLWSGGDKQRAEKDGFIIAESLEDLFACLKEYDSDSIFIIGGAMMYRTMLPYCRYVYLTMVDADGQAEVFFEDLSKLENWKLAEKSEEIIDNGYKIRFTRWDNLSVRTMS